MGSMSVWRAAARSLSRIYKVVIGMRWTVVHDRQGHGAASYGGETAALA